MAQELKDNEVTIDKDTLESFLNQLEEKNKEIRALYDGSIKVLELIGLAENGIVKKEAFEEGGNAMPEILKGAGSIMGLVVEAQAPFGMGKRAEKKLIEKFSFFKELIPMFIRYGKEFSQDQNTGG